MKGVTVDIQVAKMFFKHWMKLNRNDPDAEKVSSDVDNHLFPCLNISQVTVVLKNCLQCQYLPVISDSSELLLLTLILEWRAMWSSWPQYWPHLKKYYIIKHEYF